MKLRIIIAFAAAIVLSACSPSTNVKSHAPTEQKIAGTWETSVTEVEDGIVGITSIRETYLPNHRSMSKATIRAGYPVNARLFTVSYDGEWKASETMLVNRINRNSIEIKPNYSLLEEADVEAIKKDFFNELEKTDYTEHLIFKSHISDTFTAEDGDGETFTYTRVK